jgi:hypothetical protein
MEWFDHNALLLARSGKHAERWFDGRLRVSVTEDRESHWQPAYRHCALGHVLELARLWRTVSGREVVPLYLSCTEALDRQRLLDGLRLRCIRARLYKTTQRLA